MTFDEIAPSASPLMRALWHARKGEWDAAHQLASDDSSKMASRIHAYLHRMEGDLSNARYWYRQAGVTPETGTLEQEWELLARDLLSAESD